MGDSIQWTLCSFRAAFWAGFGAILGQIFSPILQGDASDQPLALVDFDFRSSAVFPRPGYSASSAIFSAAQAELGRQWK